MSNIKIDIPDITVVVNTGDNYNVSLQRPDTVVTNENYLYASADYATSASYAVTASYVAGDAGITDWSEIINKPSGIVSSSTQVDYNQLQNLPQGIETASYVEYANVANKPTLVSSSTQIQLDQISGTTFGSSSFTFPQNITVAGTITATEYNIVSSSIIYASGSTKFGDSVDDTHQFTGSVFIQGPLSASSITGSFKGDGSQLTGLVTDLRISGSTGTDTVSLLTDDLTITGINGIVAVVADNTITIDVPVALTSSLFGTASIAENITVIDAGIYSTGSDSVILPTPSGGLSYVTSASHALFADTANLYGTIGYIPVWESSTAVSESILYQTGSGIRIFAQNNSALQFGVNDHNVLQDSAGSPYLIATGSDLLIGNISDDQRIVFFTGGTDVATYARMFINVQGTVGLNSTETTTGNPETLFIRALNDNTYNLVTAKSNVDAYSQINLQNESTGSYASSDIVATADNGDEKGNFINIGINGSQYTGDFVGDYGFANDAYLYNTGSHLHIGNATPDNMVSFFAGGTDFEANEKFVLRANNQHSLKGNLDVTGSLTISGSATLKNIGPTIFSGSLNVTNGITGSINYNNITEIPEGLVSSSNQIVAALPLGLYSSSAQLPAGTISSSTQVVDYNIFATTGSNTFVGNQTITDGSEIRFGPSASIGLGEGSLYVDERTGYITLASYNESGQATLLNVISRTGDNEILRISSAGGVQPLLTFDKSGSLNIAAYSGTGSLLINNVPYDAHLATTGSNTFVGNQYVSGAIFFEGGSSITGNVANLELFADPSGEIILQQGYEFLKVSSQKVMATNIEATSVTGSFSGSLIGTSSWAENAATASLLLGSIESASFATTASYALVAIAQVPDGTVSSSVQVDYTQIQNIPTTIPTASYVEYVNVANKPTLVSASSQVSYTQIANVPSGIVSSSTQLPTGIVSSSTQVLNYNTFATTGSNTFTANQVITGSLYITNNLVVQGSSSVSYVSQSTLNIGTNMITVNAQNPSVRFGGLAVIDSASSPQVSGSLLFDSVENQWLYVHQNQANITSSILLMGPETYNNVGNETHPTTNRIMKSLNDEHIGDSQITDDGTVVSIPGNLHVTGNITGSNLLLSGSQFITGSINVTGSFLVNNQTVQSLNSSFLHQLSDVNDYTANTITDGFQLAWNSGSQQWAPAAGAAAKGVTRLFISANRSNANAFYFTAIQITSDNSASPDATTAFMLTSALLSKVTIYLRQDASTAGGTNSTLVRLEKNANGVAFSGATAIASQSLALTQNTVQTFTFSNLTLNQFDAIHIYCDPTNNPGQLYGIVTIE